MNNNFSEIMWREIVAKLSIFINNNNNLTLLSSVTIFLDYICHEVEPRRDFQKSRDVLRNLRLRTCLVR